MRKIILSATMALGLTTGTAFSANIVETANGAGTFKTLIAAATAAGLGDALATGKDLTVFAPTDEAFAKLPAGTVEDLLKPENKDKLAAILKYHVVVSSRPALASAPSIRTMARRMTSAADPWIGALIEARSLKARTCGLEERISG